MNLLQKVSQIDNLILAYRCCSRGKKQSQGYVKSIFGLGETIVEIHENLLSNKFRWKKYREFIVHDPKSRRIMAAPFLDRVVHHAIHQVIHPILDPTLSHRVYACRKGMGSRKAVIDLFHALKILGENRYCIKLDVRKYFDSINHRKLLERLAEKLPDNSLVLLLQSLLDSHPQYALQGVGIPIGNLTSQLFANVYLSAVDELVERSLSPENYYFRYMDDLVLVGQNKSEILDVAFAVVHCAEGQLELKIPFQKRVHIGKDPIPFLGFLVHHSGYQVLSRNIRRFQARESRLVKKGAALSMIAQVRQSHESWKDLAHGKMHL